MVHHGGVRNKTISTGCKVNRFSIEVIARNYSTGTFKLRLSQPEIGLQFDVSILDAKKLRTQLTEVSFEGKGFQELREEARAELANEWNYIDNKERP